MSVKISELPLLSTLSDNDILAGVDTSENVTSKVELATLKNYIDTNTQYTAGTNIDITNNVISAPNVYNKTETDKTIKKLQDELDAVSTIYNAFPTVSDEGESMTLDDTAESKLKKLDLKGNTSQDGTPTPSSPIPVNVVSGDNTIDICGKNLYGDILELGGINNTTGVNSSSTTQIRNVNYISIQPNITYTIDCNKENNSGIALRFYDKNKAYIEAGVTKTHPNTFTTPSNAYYLRIVITANTDINTLVQLETGSTATTYEPYIGSSYPISLGDIELCKIGSYQDSIYKGKGYNLFDKDDTNASRGYFLNSNGVETTGANWSVYYVPIQPNTTYTISGCQTNGGVNFCWFDSNKTFISNIGQKQNRTITSPSNAKYLGLSVVWNTTSSAYDSQLMVNEGSTALPYEPYNAKDKWLLHKEIKKKELNGSEGWSLVSWGQNPFKRCLLSISDLITTIPDTEISPLYCTRFSAGSYRNALLNTMSYRADNNQLNLWEDVVMTNNQDWANWLAENPMTLYYVLATPTNTLIEDTTLIEQLEALKLATSYEGQTNIAQENNDKPFILDVEAIKKLT